MWLWCHNSVLLGHVCMAWVLPSAVHSLTGTFPRAAPTTSPNFFVLTAALTVGVKLGRCCEGVDTTRKSAMVRPSCQRFIVAMQAQTDHSVTVHVSRLSRLARVPLSRNMYSAWPLVAIQITATSRGNTNYSDNSR